MKLFYKMFLGIFGTTLLLFTVFGTYLVGNSYRSALEREQESAFQESQMYQYAFLTAYGNLSENNRTEENAVSVATSVWESMGDVGSAFLLTNEGGKNLYQSRVFSWSEDDIELQAGQSSGIIIENDGKYYLEINSCMAVDDEIYYMRLGVDITHIYLDREELIRQYRVAILAVFVVAGIWSFLLSSSLTKPLHKLSEVSTRFAKGDYKIRAKQQRNDEVGDLVRDFNQMADTLEQNMEDLKLAAKQQEDFTAAFAHELKTPLTSIIGYGDMIRSMDLSQEELRSCANYIYQQGKRLERLSYKLMEMMGIEKHRDEFGKVDMKQLEKELTKILTPLLEEKEIVFTSNVAAGTIWGDLDLLISLLANLIDNARKACDKGGKILIQGVKEAESYIITIQDNGRGIPEKELGRITEAFYMVDKSRSRKEGGAGIGLALCGRIIDIHEGIWRFESELEKGTRVTVEFPIYGLERRTTDEIGK